MSLPLAAKGEFALVRSNLESALDKSGQPVRRGTMAHDHHVYMLLTEAAVGQRDSEAMAMYAPRLAALAERDGHRLYQAVAARALGVASRLAGDLPGAAIHLNRAMDIFASLGTHWQLGRTYVERAELARALNDSTGAREFLAHAISFFEIQKATPDWERAKDALTQPRNGLTLKSACLNTRQVADMYARYPVEPNEGVQYYPRARASTRSWHVTLTPVNAPMWPAGRPERGRMRPLSCRPRRRDVPTAARFEPWRA